MLFVQRGELCCRRSHLAWSDYLVVTASWTVLVFVVKRPVYFISSSSACENQAVDSLATSAKITASFCHAWTLGNTSHLGFLWRVLSLTSRCCCHLSQFFSRKRKGCNGIKLKKKYEKLVMVVVSDFLCSGIMLAELSPSKEEVTRDVWQISIKSKGSESILRTQFEAGLWLGAVRVAMHVRQH